MTHLLALGMGYSAAEAAHRLRAKGWTVAGTGRSSESLRRITEQGFTALPFDGRAVPDPLAANLVSATHLLLSIPPDEDGDPVLRACGPLIRRAPNLKWIGYLSTIGVYGDHGGAWVDEATPPAPRSGRSRARVEAEQAWAALARERGVPLDIFRLSGIYGPGRNPLERLLSGERQTVVKPGQVFNRIHVEDIGQAVERAIERPGEAGAARIFNVTDDEPAPPQDVTAFAAQLLGMEPPPLVPIEQAQLSDMGRSFYAENKRARNERMKRDLGVALAYPTYREGLRALAARLRPERG